MNPAPSRPAACLRPLPNPPRPKAGHPGPRPIGRILDEIRRSPGGVAGEARRIAAKGGLA